MSAPFHDIHISNLVTYASLASGIASIGLSADGRHLSLAAAALAMAVVADAFDGRFARLFKRTTRQAQSGKELDSLVDAIAFGIAPAVVLFSAVSAANADKLPSAIWFLATLSYALAAVTRLAHYNVEDDGARFVGMPTPVAALVCSTSLLVPLASAGAIWPLLVGALAMVAPISFPRPRGFGLAAFTCWAVIVIAIHAARGIG